MPPRSYHSYLEPNPYFVEQYFPSIDRLRENLHSLRQNMLEIVPSELIDYFDNIDEHLFSLKSIMIAREALLYGQTYRNQPIEIIERPGLEIFQETIIIAHFDRLDLCETIEAIDPNEINLIVVFFYYRLVEEHLFELSTLFPEIQLDEIFFVL
ncbi:hypothetical protein SSS_04885 [Sarcoptes scabiei]|uniref:Uncharacterized protein n=1 Tax=Sarcoptes scabiei TaxID=52283 RepID=A0A834VIE9_SARSC|nr:hypothetical protein SSS_04885 [Sarcoptes scabiei]